MGVTLCRKMRSFGMILIRMSDPRSLHPDHGALETDESTLVTDSSVPLMHHDPSGLGSLIWIQIIPKERIQSEGTQQIVMLFRVLPKFWSRRRITWSSRPRNL